jgi:uncharacterized protein YdaU (DUF1376 family)
MPEKSPAFQFYPKDWLSDVKVMSMTPAQRGIYIQLLCFMWLEDDCSLPSSTEFLSTLTNGLQPDIEVVKKCFYEDGGRLHQKRLCKEKKKQEEYRQKASIGGKNSAARRWGKASVENKGTYDLVTTTLQPNCNTSSSTPEDIYIGEQQDEKPKKERKKNFVPPTEKEVIDYVVAKGYPEGLGKGIFEYYNDADWIDSKGSKVNNWKQKIFRWLSEENRIKYKNYKPPEKREIKAPSLEENFDIFTS